MYPGGIQLLYPTGPYKLSPTDIPGYESSTLPDQDVVLNEVDAWGWWRRDPGGGKYLKIEEGLKTIAEAIRELGGIDGVIGFSQGGAAAAMLASLLEPGRKSSFQSQLSQNPSALPFPKDFENLQNEPLKFAVSYSGFKAPSELYTAFYEPKIETPLLQVVGSLDTLVDESRSMELADACIDGRKRLVYHPGGHFVPTGKEMVGVLTGFIRDCCVESHKEETGVEDMDVPS